MTKGEEAAEGVTPSNFRRFEWELLIGGGRGADS